MCNDPQIVKTYGQESHNYTMQSNPRHREEETHSTKDTQQQEDNESKANSYFFIGQMIAKLKGH